MLMLKEVMPNAHARDSQRGHVALNAKADEHVLGLGHMSLSSIGPIQKELVGLLGHRSFPRSVEVPHIHPPFPASVLLLLPILASPHAYQPSERAIAPRRAQNPPTPNPNGHLFPCRPAAAATATATAAQ